MGRSVRREGRRLLPVVDPSLEPWSRAHGCDTGFSAAGRAGLSPIHRCSDVRGHSDDRGDARATNYVGVSGTSRVLTTGARGSCGRERQRSWPVELVTGPVDRLSLQSDRNRPRPGRRTAPAGLPSAPAARGELARGPRLLAESAGGRRHGRGIPLRALRNCRGGVLESQRAGCCTRALGQARGSRRARRRTRDPGPQLPGEGSCACACLRYRGCASCTRPHEGAGSPHRQPRRSRPPHRQWGGGNDGHVWGAFACGRSLPPAKMAPSIRTRAGVREQELSHAFSRA